MRQWLVKGLLALAGIVVALVLCEVGLRLLGIEYPNFYDYDPQLGSKLRSGVKGRWLKEGGGYVSINADGLRDREHSLSPPPNTIRIAVLGDSFTEAMQVDLEETFWAVMGKDLEGCQNLCGQKVEVINFGQSGFGTTQELLALRHRVWKYAPQVVLLAFYTGNDVADNSRALKQKDYHPYHVYQDGKLILDDQRTREKWSEEVEKNDWRRELYRWRLDTFRVSQVLHQAKKAIQEWWKEKRPGDQSQSSQEGSEAGLAQAIYREPADEVWKEAWKVTEDVLLLMRDDVAHQGAKFFVVVLTNGIQVHPDPAVRREFAKRLGVGDLFYPDRRVETFCQREGIPVLLLAPSFQEYATTHKVFVHGFKDTLGTGHWNQLGHRLAGQTIATWLCRQLP